MPKYRDYSSTKLCTKIGMGRELSSLIDFLHILAVLLESEGLTFLIYHNQTVSIYMSGYNRLTQWVETKKGPVNI